ncbi:MAG: glycoside hydrolase family 3 C-terminal domain-containing protein [Oscillospiraceae bacterium]
MKTYPFRDSNLPVEERLSDLLCRLTTEEKINMLSSHMAAVPRLGISEWFVGTEAARGFVGRTDEDISTVFPQPIGMASMFDPELMYRIGEITGNEARYYYQKAPDSKLMLWGPTVDMERDPRWGRTEEAYGEDPFLTGEMTKAYTKGMAGEDPFYLKTIPTLKHFCADNNEADRASCSANVEPRTLHEYYYRAFKPAITEGGAHSVMAAYNELSGVPAVMNPDLQKLLKDEWGLDFVVTDGGDFSQNLLVHKCVETHGEALALCIKNGADSMTDPEDMVAAAARDALKRGLITESDVDKAVGNVLYGRFRLGEFDEEHPYKNMNVAVDSEESRAVNREAAMKQVCLLKNDGILPLDKNTKVAVIGPLADENYCDWYTGRASYAVSIKQGMENEFGKDNILFDNGYDIVAIKSCKNGKYLTVCENGAVKAISEKIADSTLFEMHDWGFGSINFKSCANGKYVTEDGTYKAVSKTPYEWFIREWFKPTVFEGKYSFRSWHDWAMDIFVNENDELAIRRASRMTPDKQFEIEIVSRGTDRVKKLAESADKAIVCVGNHPMQVARECYDRPDIILPESQSRLIEAVYGANPNTVLAVVSSYPYAINAEKEKLPAIVYTSHAGPELGTAFAASISGRNNPAARCPMTWYRSIHELPDIKDYDIITNNTTYMYYDGEPIFPFGHGLSYSKFEYSGFTAVQQGNTVKTSVTVKNISERDGDEVVQIYFKANKPRVKRPLRQLCGFKRVNIKAGEAVTVNIDVPLSALEFYDVTREKLCTESGMYTFSAGASSLDIRCICETEISGETIPPRNMACVTKAKNYDGKDNISLNFSYDKNDHYVLGGDWGGSIMFDSADMNGYTCAELLCSAPCSGKKIEIYAGEKLIGSADIKPSSRCDGFELYMVPLEPVNGIMPLRIRLGGMLGIYSVKFL